MPEKRHSFKIPKEVSRVTETLEKAGFEAYIVGGCVRDLILGRKPKDWDVTTNAKPENIQSLFEETFYENSFGTVGVVNETKDETLKVIEVTPYRLESQYSDRRRPDSVTFSDNLEDDLKRRDFSINAIACSISKGQIVDPHKGQNDIAEKTIRTVGDPNERFEEDGLRILRAIRLHAELGFTINTDTEKALKNKAELLEQISAERIRDEFQRIILSDNPMESLILSHKLGILKYVVPELEEGVDMEQTQAHAFDVFNHSLKTLQHSADQKWPLEVRLASLFHDIGKPRSRRKEGGKWTFHGHDVIGARITENRLKELHFPKEIVEKVVKLVRWHMFFSDTEQISLSAVRRLLSNVGQDTIWDLINVRRSDRIGTGRPKEQPYRLRKYQSMIEEVMRDPVSVGMLKIDGKKVMEITKLAPGPKIGFILHALLEEVLEDPKKNKVKELEEMTNKLAKLPEKELQKLGKKGKETKEKTDEEERGELRKKYWVE